MEAPQSDVVVGQAVHILVRSRTRTVPMAAMTTRRLSIGLLQQR